MIFVRPDLQPLFADAHSVADFARIDGEVYKQFPDRRTARFERAGRPFFIKFHSGVGWPEIFKNLASLRLPVLGAQNEWRAIAAFERLGLDTMRVAAYGREGWNPARLRSFLVTEALSETVTLEEWAHGLYSHDNARERCCLKRVIIHQVAQIAARMHHNGVNHRDFYLCHLRLDCSVGDPYRLCPRIRIYVMDLHRVQLRRRTPTRWAVKDVAALLFAAWCQGGELRLTTRDYLRFIETYAGMPWREALRVGANFWRWVVRRATRMYVKMHGHPPAVPRLFGDLADAR